MKKVASLAVLHPAFPADAVSSLYRVDSVPYWGTSFITGVPLTLLGYLFPYWGTSFLTEVPLTLLEYPLPYWGTSFLTEVPLTLLGYLFPY